MLRTLLIFAILVPGIIFALTDRYKALLLYLWWAFFRPQEWIWFNISSLRLSLGLGVILMIASDAWQVLNDVNTVRSQLRFRTDAGLHQHLGRVDGPHRQDHFAIRHEPRTMRASNDFHAGNARSAEHQSSHLRMCQDGEIRLAQLRQDVRAED